MLGASFVGQTRSSRIFLKENPLLAGERATWNLKETSVFQVPLISWMRTNKLFCMAHFGMLDFARIERS
jgi:hypothetical protein